MRRGVVIIDEHGVVRSPTERDDLFREVKPLHGAVAHRHHEVCTTTLALSPECLNRVRALLPYRQGAGDQVASQDAQGAEHEQPECDEESQSQQCQCEFGQRSPRAELDDGGTDGDRRVVHERDLGDPLPVDPGPVRGPEITQRDRHGEHDLGMVPGYACIVDADVDVGAAADARGVTREGVDEAVDDEVRSLALSLDRGVLPHFCADAEQAGAERGILGEADERRTEHPELPFRGVLAHHVGQLGAQRHLECHESFEIVRREVDDEDVRHDGMRACECDCLIVEFTLQRGCDLDRLHLRLECTGECTVHELIDALLEPVQQLHGNLPQEC